ncbi:uncharacterized protein LOC112170699 [Rosa chinensis]|uniref:uncharacterized protein LOC112170699 n=1 Tax=Rosa chinensis TaxID=74649 RepID=UPI000D0970A5|nr:uncharacterized protein LOC112170699 [Rosa chinensis]
MDLEYIPRERNFAANELSQLATGVTLKYEVRERILKVERCTLPSWLARSDPPDESTMAALDPIDVDWHIWLITYLKQPNPTIDRKIHFLALNYFLRGDELRRPGEDGIDFRFGIPEVLVSDKGATFMGADVEKLVNDCDIQFIHSTPYYAQSNGHAEAILPLEVNVQSLRVQDQNHLIGEDYVQAIWQEHEDISDKRLEALDSLVMEKQLITLAYDKRMCGRSYKEGELVWKAILPLGEKLTGHGKWTLRWEGPFVVHRILERGAFHLKYLDADIHHNPINGRFLKKYYPSVWEFKDPPALPVSGTGGQP